MSVHLLIIVTRIIMSISIRVKDQFLLFLPFSLCFRGTFHRHKRFTVKSFECHRATFLAPRVKASIKFRDISKSCRGEVRRRAKKIVKCEGEKYVVIRDCTESFVSRTKSLFRYEIFNFIEIRLECCSETRIPRQLTLNRPKGDHN